MLNLETVQCPLDPVNKSAGTLVVWRSGATNLGYVIQPGTSQRVIAVDVTSGAELTGLLRRHQWTLSAVLLTHTHHDHVNGLVEVVNETGCDLFAAVPFGNLPRRQVTDGLSWQVEGLNVLAWDTSGHTESDFTYLFPDFRLCFCGDTLFDHGCGRMFAGPPERFWASLLRLRSLPDETRMACGHDFREDNADFLSGECQALPWARETADRLREQARSTFPVPFPLHTQKQTNPFLKSDDPRVAQAMGRSGALPRNVFSELRARRNSY